MTDDQDRIVARFILAAMVGDVPGFRLSLQAITWPDAWREVMIRLQSIDHVNPDVRAAFKAHWRDFDPNPETAMKRHKPSIWPLTRDLDHHPELLRDGLRLLLPSTEPRPSPLVLFRGQSAHDHQRGTYGPWWTPDPTYAEVFARERHRSVSGPGAVVAVIDPSDAIVCKVDHFQYLLDTTKLSDVFTLGTLPTYTAAEQAAVPLGMALLSGIPNGYDKEGLSEWLALDRPLSGLQRYWDESARAQGIYNKWAS
ncbi:hypothetical protein IPV08_23510 [Methylobacterium sp. SD274]|uniref:hypothetical protein n=1 Tax=Methylobacterium sp. SD274 TaxID=2782009 RepID=UPI001A97005B|nr:hypothetical protein [Methylobacterium sp. SD274]MBO1022929.1 hypothetical protein [Methylobacterium sp. SD274]